jgi:hypothetical protein
MNPHRVDGKIDRVSLLNQLANYVAIILEPMKMSADEKHTDDLMNSEIGFSSVLIDIPVMWMESIQMRLESGVDGKLYISVKEIEVLLSMIDFLESTDVVGEIDNGIRSLLLEMAVINKDHTGIHI